jgi:hypothetical protein
MRRAMHASAKRSSVLERAGKEIGAELARRVFTPRTTSGYGRREYDSALRNGFTLKSFVSTRMESKRLLARVAAVLDLEPVHLAPGQVRRVHALRHNALDVEFDRPGEQRLTVRF